MKAAGALRRVRQRGRDPRRRLRRHPARGRQGPRLRAAHPPHRAGAAAGACARRARRPLGARRADRLPDCGRSRNQDFRSDQSAPLSGRLSLHRHGRRDRRGRRRRASARLQSSNRRGARSASRASQAAGLRENFGTMTKPFHAGRACESGVVAAEFARLGFTATPIILEAGRGFFKAAGGGYDAAGDRRQARQSMDVRFSRRFDQAASERLAHASRHGADARPDSQARHQARADQARLRSASTARHQRADP